MLIENLYFRPDEAVGDDFFPNHLKHFAAENPVAFDQFRSVRRLLCNTLNMPDFRSAVIHLRSIEEHTPEWNEINANLCVAMCRQYGRELPTEVAVTMVEDAMQTAVGALDRFTNPETGLLSEQASIVGQMSGPQEHHEPLMLFQMITDPDTYTRIVRFEATRKWELAQEALSIHLNESQAITSLALLTDIFNKSVWNGGKVGTTETIECISRHNPENFRCIDTQILRFNDKAVLDEYSFYHRLRMRRTPDGTLAMWEHRVKPPEDQLLKLMRRRRKDPDYDLDDMRDAIGMRLVFQDKNDVLKFEAYFRETVAAHGHRLIEIEREDTLENEHGVAQLSSGDKLKPEILKIVYELDGIPFEVQLQTLRTYFDYFAADEISHAEYNIDRAVILASLLFPHSIYGLDTPELMQEALLIQKESKPNSWRELPAKHSSLKMEQKPFGRRRQEKGAHEILRKIEISGWRPDWIIAETSASTLSRLLTEKLACPVLLVNFHNESFEDELRPIIEMTKKKNVLLAVNVSHTGETLNRIEELFPTARSTALVCQGGKVDYAAEVESDGNTWYHFS